MSTINIATHQNIALTIGGRNWTPWLESFTIGWDEFDLSRGIVRVAGSIRLNLGLVQAALPTSANTRANAANWDRGVVITIVVDGNPLPCAGGRLFILNRPQRPFGLNQFLDISVGCELSLRSYFQATPEENPTGIAYTPNTRSNAIRSVLRFTGINPAHIGAIETTDNLEFPVDKQSGGLVDFAGQLAAGNRVMLFCGADGDIISRSWGVGANSITVSPQVEVNNSQAIDYVELAPQSDFTAAPVEEFFTRSVTYDVESIGNITYVTQKYNSRLNLFGVGSTDLIVWQKETISFQIGINSETTTTTIETILGVLLPEIYPLGTDFRINQITINTRSWNTDNSLRRIVTNTQYPLAVIDFAAFGANFSTYTTVEQLEEIYTYNNKQRVTAITKNKSIPKKLTFNLLVNSLTELTIVEQSITTWVEKIITWKETTTRNIPKGYAYPELYPNNFELIAVSADEPETDNPPPATNFRTPLYKVKETPIEVKITSPQPSNDPNPRIEDVFIPFISGQSQLNTWAQTYLQLRLARNNGWFATIPYYRILPGDRVVIRDGSTDYRMVADAITYEYSADRFVVSFSGLGTGETDYDSLGGATDYELPELTITAIGAAIATIACSPTSILENAGTPIVIAVTASAPVVGNQSVEVFTSGDISNFTTVPPPLVTIVDGQTTGSFSLTVLDDLTSESNANLSFTIGNPTPGLTIGSPSVANLTIVDNDPPTVSVSPGGTIFEGSPQSIVFSRTGTTAAALEVFYALSGSADAADYTPILAGSVVIPIGQSSVTIEVVAVEELVFESTETLVITLQSDPAYLLSVNTIATITIEEVPANLVVNFVASVTTSNVAPVTENIIVNFVAEVTSP